MCVALLFSVLHQQINCCFILAFANNQNIIMELVAHGGMIFYSAHTDTHTHYNTSFMHAHKMQRGATPPHTPLTHTFTHLHSHSHTHALPFCTPTRGKGALLFDAARRALAGFCFTPFRVAFLGVMRGGLGSSAQPAPRETKPGPRRRVAALQSRDLDLPGPSLRFSSFIALSPGI